MWAGVRLHKIILRLQKEFAMKRLVNCILALPVCMGLPACALASEIVWKGGDGMPDWNDDATWEGGKRPLAGDTAVIPEIRAFP